MPRRGSGRIVYPRVTFPARRVLLTERQGRIAEDANARRIRQEQQWQAIYDEYLARMRRNENIDQWFQLEAIDAMKGLEDLKRQREIELFTARPVPVENNPLAPTQLERAVMNPEPSLLNDWLVVLENLRVKVLEPIAKSAVTHNLLLERVNKLCYFFLFVVTIKGKGKNNMTGEEIKLWNDALMRTQRQIKPNLSFRAINDTFKGSGSTAAQFISVLKVWLAARQIGLITTTVEDEAHNSAMLAFFFVFTCRIFVLPLARFLPVKKTYEFYFPIFAGFLAAWKKTKDEHGDYVRSCHIFKSSLKDYIESFIPSGPLQSEEDTAIELTKRYIIEGGVLWRADRLFVFLDYVQKKLMEYKDTMSRNSILALDKVISKASVDPTWSDRDAKVALDSIWTADDDERARLVAEYDKEAEKKRTGEQENEENIEEQKTDEESRKRMREVDNRKTPILIETQSDEDSEDSELDPFERRLMERKTSGYDPGVQDRIIAHQLLRIQDDTVQRTRSSEHDRLTPHTDWERTRIEAEKTRNEVIGKTKKLFGL